jgi:hypothetical protein
VWASRCASRGGPVRLDQQPGTLSSLRRAGELSSQRSCSASAHGDPYVYRSDAVTPTYRGRGRGVSWPLVGVMALHSCPSGQRPAAFRVRPRGRSGSSQTKGDWGPARRASAPGVQSATGPFGECRRVRRCSVVEMLEASDGEQRFCHKPTSLQCDHIFARFKVHFTGCDSRTDMQ